MGTEGRIPFRHEIIVAGERWLDRHKPKPPSLSEDALAIADAITSVALLLRSFDARLLEEQEVIASLTASDRRIAADSLIAAHDLVIGVALRLQGWKAP
jgi:hypothetical protein